ncbi:MULTISPECIES: hypothetical protein [Microbacterium]|uniref:DUF4190 domain-containing protein n=1 Tax=Microbacterium wangchenii TaxID=2541726 RepID=A0ABX5SSK4_9MICO|nr:MULTISPECIES: hypothetical protein [Microbacterium]MCK6068507.1 hypothetical protein [Microbacterium sp. EYE_512]QBR89145.1 hypothetical protein E4K62_10885 [Microbacterium wangchenii]TXK09223.1 hypothetical protein FVP99_18310 [Microbacterium wangchenii]
MSGYLLLWAAPWLTSTGLLGLGAATFVIQPRSILARLALLVTGMILVVASGVAGLVGLLFASSDVTRVVVAGCLSPVLVEEQFGGVGTVWLLDGPVARAVGLTLTDDSYRPFADGNYSADLDETELIVWYGRSVDDNANRDVATGPDVRIPLPNAVSETCG